MWDSVFQGETIMKIMRDYPQVTVSKKGERWLDNGHPWVYESDVTGITGNHENGDIVDVIGPKGKYLGSGFLSLASKIRVRIFSRDSSSSYDEDFWYRRIRYAWQYRKTVMDSLQSCRMIFGESDQLPGLTVDKFDKILVTQIVTYGMEKIRDTVYPLLVRVLEEDGFEIDGIYQRNDVNNRQLEGLELYKGWYQLKDREIPDYEETVIEENGIRYYVDFVNGQKTGYFLDQKRNRRLVGEIAGGKKVLDCFTHTGSFALNCAYGGAASVTAVDISQTALDQAKRNAELNGLKVNFVQADVFEYLEKVRKKEFDLIILDPPAFTKSRKTVDHAYNGYLEINMKAMSLLSRGGYLATCSCSHFMPHELFEKMLKEASYRTGYQLKLISVTQQNRDHPIMLNVPETDYLKFYIIQIV